MPYTFAAFLQCFVVDHEMKAKCRIAIVTIPKKIDVATATSSCSAYAVCVRTSMFYRNNAIIVYVDDVLEILR